MCGSDFETKFKDLLALPVQKYRKSYCTFPSIGVHIGSCGRVNKMFKFYIKVFYQYFLNPQMDLVYIWYDYRCWSTHMLLT